MDLFRHFCPHLNEVDAPEGRQRPMTIPGVELSRHLCPHLDYYRIACLSEIHLALVKTFNIEIIFDNVTAFALEAVSIRASSGRTREAGGERQRGPEGQLLRHSYAMPFLPGRELFRHTKGTWNVDVP